MIIHQQDSCQHFFEFFVAIYVILANANMTCIRLCSAADRLSFSSEKFFCLQTWLQFLYEALRLFQCCSMASCRRTVSFDCYGLPRRQLLHLLDMLCRISCTSSTGNFNKTSRAFCRCWRNCSGESRRNKSSTMAL